MGAVLRFAPFQFTYRLKGMICYYGLHYDCYFYSPQRKQWLVFDDRVVKEVTSPFLPLSFIIVCRVSVHRRFGRGLRDVRRCGLESGAEGA
jgi:hypothetical protein